VSLFFNLSSRVIDGVRRFAMDVRELDIDLIDRINPFGEAYAILAKTMSEDSLKQVAAANRTVCEDFEQFKPLFARVAKELEAGIRITRQIRKDAGFLKADIKEGEFFILGGQTAYIAEVGEPIRAPNGEFDARLRVIYSNATESNILLVRFSAHSTRMRPNRRASSSRC
jgi:hypothetical protein